MLRFLEMLIYYLQENLTNKKLNFYIIVFINFCKHNLLFTENNVN